jgi:hypothetical protein
VLDGRRAWIADVEYDYRWTGWVPGSEERCGVVDTDSRLHFFSIEPSGGDSASVKSAGEPIPLHEDESRPSIHENGKTFVVRDEDNHQVVRSTADLKEIGKVSGYSGALRLDLLLVESEERGEGDLIAYQLPQMSLRWRTKDFGLLDEVPDRGHYQPIGGGGYGIADLTSGRRLARWEASGHACGYIGAWRGDSFVFLEGDRVTFWSDRSPAVTEQTECAGTHLPIFYEDGKRLLGFASIWTLDDSRRIAKLELSEHEQLGDVAGLAFNERLVLGTLQRRMEWLLGFWDATTGRQVHQLPAIPDRVWLMGEDEHVPWLMVRESPASFAATYDPKRRILIWHVPMVSVDADGAYVGHDRLRIEPDCVSGPVSKELKAGAPVEIPGIECE